MFRFKISLMTDLSQKSNRLLPSGHHINHHTVILAGVFISFLIIILALTIANSRTSFFGRAASTSSSVRLAGNISLENSYLFASPISAAADGSSIIRITAIILSDTGLGISGQKVTLTAGNDKLKITPTQPVTDTFGRAIFDVTSSSPGDYTISAEVSSQSLPQTVAVVFR